MNHIRLWIIRFLSKKVLRFYTEDDVLTVINRAVFIGDSKLTDEEIGMLKEEAAILQKSMLWRFAKRNIGYLATLKMGKDARNRDDIFIGNAMYANLDIIEKFIQRIKSL